MGSVGADFNPNISHSLYFVRKGLYKAIKKYAPQLTGKLMDFGCGTKPYRPLFNVTGYTGVDFEGEGHSHHLEEIDYYYDGQHLPFNDHEFDSIFSSETFEHVFNLSEMLEELNRVLKPGGKFLITCPFIWNEHETPNDFARYTQYALQDMLQKSGFEVISSYKTGNFIEALFQLNILFAVPYIYKIPVLWRIINPLYCIICNSVGLVCSFIFSKRKDLYLNNVVLAQKIGDDKHSTGNK